MFRTPTPIELIELEEAGIEPKDWAAALQQKDSNDEYYTLMVTPCAWYAKCDRPASGFVRHPVLGKVPTCQRCADRHELKLEVPA